MSIPADELVQSYFRRWQSPETRYSDLARLLAHLDGDRSHFACKAFKKAGEFLGIDDQEARRRIHHTVKHGYKGWAVPQIHRQMFGFVYVCSPDGYPNVLKVGFSTDLPARLASLSAEAGQCMSIISSSPGTMVHEAVAHREAANRRIFGEWFYADASGSFLLPPKLGPSPREILMALGRTAA